MAVVIFVQQSHETPAVYLKWYVVSVGVDKTNFSTINIALQYSITIQPLKEIGILFFHSNYYNIAKTFWPF